jgi:hypothetical protein
MYTRRLLPLDTQTRLYSVFVDRMFASLDWREIEMVQLTQEQALAVHAADGVPVAVVDPLSQETYFIVTAQDCDLLRELAEEARVIAAFTEASARNAFARLKDEP